MNARAAEVTALEVRLGHSFASPDLLEQALTHASVGEGARKVLNNERLEFLGDRVLGLFTAEVLMAQFPTAREGDLSQRYNMLVNREACARARPSFSAPICRTPTSTATASRACG